MGSFLQGYFLLQMIDSWGRGLSLRQGRLQFLPHRERAGWAQPGWQGLRRAICVQGRFVLAYFLLSLQGVCLIYGWGTAIWLEGRERSPAPKSVSKGWQRRMRQVPFDRVLLRQIYLQIWNLERQLSLSRHFLTSLGIILIIEPFKRVPQKWIKSNSLLKLPEASQLRNEFL